MKLLSVSSDAKTIKGEKRGYLTGILYLAPANTSGVANVCTSATPGCKQSCLNTAGRAGIFPAILIARARKTRELFADRNAFMLQLGKDVAALIRLADRQHLTPCVRVNGTSDLPWLAHAMATRFPTVQFYDYTKHPRPWERIRENYHLTFSHSESNRAQCLQALAHGVNVAVVFDTPKSKALPETWEGYRVINGDETDLRFLDGFANDLRGLVVGLHAKGRAKRDCTGFVVKSNLITIGAGLRNPMLKSA